MPTLYTYCIPGDDGAAPNPFWGICTLNICKPVIRRVASVGDWVVGTGSKRYGMDGKVVYAMKVTQKMTMQQYEVYCQAQLPNKIPVLRSSSYQRRLGDCIYDFSNTPPSVRPSVHNVGNRNVDLGGKHTLLSEHFYYFGSEPRALPAQLLPIVHQGQGHKSKLNAGYLEHFVKWITDQTDALNKVVAEPYSKHQFLTDRTYLSTCAARDREDDERDEELFSRCGENG